MWVTTFTWARCFAGSGDSVRNSGWATNGVCLVSYLLFLLYIDDLTDLAVVRDDWEGEDDVQDDWDAEEKPAKPVVPAAAPPKKTVKPIVPKELPLATETEQERKVRLDRLVKERDLDNAMGLFGLSLEARNVEQEPSSRAPSEANTLLFETFTPTNIPEFDHFSRIITKRLEAFEV